MTATPAIMLQGTGSDVGKSLLAAGLGRAFLGRGLKVRPFKPQNMSNNAAVTAGGGEIGRAQALQARACGPRADHRHEPGLVKAADGYRRASYCLRKDLGLRPGRGIPGPQIRPAAGGASILRAPGGGRGPGAGGRRGQRGGGELRAGDIANMASPRPPGCPSSWSGDIDRGGVIASLVGTHRLLQEGERNLLKGFIVNKFPRRSSPFR